MRWLIAVFFCGAICPAPGAQTDIERAFNRLYNFDFPGAHAAVDHHIAQAPEDPLGYAIRGVAYLFSELDRLKILEGEFLVNDKRIIDKRKLKPDLEIRERFLQANREAQGRAERRLAANPNDRDGLFTMCIVTGTITDYTAFIEKRQIGSFSTAKLSNSYGQKLLRADPEFYDGYLTSGINEYVIGSLPFFLRWFIHFDGIEGNKAKSLQSLTMVAERGHYFGPFARILMAIVHMREKRPADSLRLLEGLERDFPSNPLIRYEREKLATQLKAGGR